MPQTTILCIGAAHIDRAAHVQGPVRLAASNPVALRTRVGGVACNVARNLARLENEAVLIAAVGRDTDGDAVAGAVATAGVDPSSLVRDDRPTGSYVAVLDDAGELVIGLAHLEICDAMTPAALSRENGRFGSAAAVVVDANLPPETLVWIAENAPQDQPLFACAVSPAKAVRLEPLLPRLAGLFANRQEAAVLNGADPAAITDPVALARELQSKGPDAVFITLGPDGAAAAAADFAGKRAPPVPDPLRDVIGAGDGLMAGAVDALLRGRSTEDALRQGLAVASLACESDQAANATLSPAAVAARVSAP